MNRIYLIHHAQSAQHAPSLSYHGHRQASKLAKHLQTTHPDKIITSPENLSAFTAHKISVFHDLPVEIEPRISSPITDGFFLWWSEISKYEGTVLVIADGTIIRFILSRTSDPALEQVNEISVHPASISLIEANRVVSINQTEHLEDLC